MMEELELEQGKYTVKHENGKIDVLRYGEIWRNETGDKLILAMFQEIQRLNAVIEYDRYANKEEKSWENDLYELLKQCRPHIEHESELNEKVNDVIKAMNV